MIMSFAVLLGLYIKFDKVGILIILSKENPHSKVKIPSVQMATHALLLRENLLTCFYT